MTIAPVDPDIRKALAKDAEGLLGDGAFAIAIKTLRMQWYSELITDGTDVSRVLESDGEIASAGIDSADA